MENPEALVQAQLEAYNRHDIEAFVATYSPTITLLAFPGDEILASGLDELRARYLKRFENPRLHARIVNRMVLGNHVIDYEEVEGILDGELYRTIAIYEIQAGLIERAWFIR